MIMLSKPKPDWPTTVEEAVDRMLARLTHADKERVRNTPEQDLDGLHFGLGTAIRNKCGLWDENRDLLAACGSPDMHPDSASAVIVRAVWERLLAG